MASEAVSDAARHGNEADGQTAGVSSGYPNAEAELVADQGDEQQEAAGSSRFGALLGSASSFKKKASPFLSKARQAIVEEAKQLKDDVRDVAGGVREGMQLTKQDLQEQTRGWRSAFGAKLRSFQKREDSPTGTPQAGEAEDSRIELQDSEAKVDQKDLKDSKESKLQTLRQNLANTAKDVNELRQEVMDEVRLSVNDIRQVLRGGTEEGTEKTESTEDSKVASTGETTGDGGFNAVKASAASVFRKAGDLREGLRHRLDKSEKQAFWHLPSTSANYVQLNLNPEASEASDAVNRVKKLGGKLKGSIAKKGREVANLAHDIRQRHAMRSESKEVKSGQTDELNLGDSIFAIGSDEEDWSDGWEGTSDGGHSETPSTRSASRAEGEAAATQPLPAEHL